MPDIRLETVILTSLVFDEDYTRKVLPFLKEEYFQDKVEREVFCNVKDFFDRFNQLPTVDALKICAKESKTLQQTEYDQIQQYLDLIEKCKKGKVVKEWLLDRTEKFCQEMAVHNALMLSVAIDSGEVKNMDRGMIPKVLTDALAVSFDPHIGHDYIEDAENRYMFYHRIENHIPLDLTYFNKITKGGFIPKTLNVIMAGTGVGKTLIMCHFASSFLSNGKNVLYITLEMSEESIAERIDANLMNVGLDMLRDLPKETYQKRIKNIRDKTIGKLIIKEYPTATAHVGHFRHCLNELLLKKSFKPDVIFVDYINICTSSRIKAGSNATSYTLVKAIAEELRGLGVEYVVPIFSATQTTRSGAANSDPELQDTSESFGLPATADFMIAAIRSEELDKLGQIMFKQLKNRYTDFTVNKKFVVGLDKSKMKLFDVEQTAQEDIADSGQDEKEERLAISRKHGSQAYQPGYKKNLSKDKFSKFKFKKEDDEAPF